MYFAVVSFSIFNHFRFLLLRKCLHFQNPYWKWLFSHDFKHFTSTDIPSKECHETARRCATMTTGQRRTSNRFKDFDVLLVPWYRRLFGVPDDEWNSGHLKQLLVYFHDKSVFTVYDTNTNGIVSSSCIALASIGHSLFPRYFPHQSRIVIIDKHTGR